MIPFWKRIRPPFFWKQVFILCTGNVLGVKKVSLIWKFLSALVETLNVKPLLFHVSVSLGWKACWQHSRMTEALRDLWGTCWWFKPGLILNSCWLQALPTPQSTSALCSCFCSRVGQSKRVPAKASASKLPLLPNHLSLSVSMLRMGWTCWQSSSRYCTETQLSCHSSCSWAMVEDCASCHHPVTPPWGPHDGLRDANPEQGKNKRTVALGFFVLPPQQCQHVQH